MLFTQNFYGISFAGGDVRYAYAISAILNSSLTSFQLAFGGPTWGLERPTVEPHDLLSLRLPDLTALDSLIVERLIRAEARAALDPKDPVLLEALDEAVFDAYDLDIDERTLARDSVDRARHLIFENRSERSALIISPRTDQLKAYAAQVTQTVDAYLRARNERHLEAIVYPAALARPDYASGLPGVPAVRLVMATGGPGREAIVREGDPSELEALSALLRGQFDTSIPPYLNERRQIRLYGSDDLFILKPSEIRNWSRTAGLNDADVILADHWLHRGNALADA